MAWRHQGILKNRGATKRFAHVCECGRPCRQEQCHECLKERKLDSTYGDDVYPGSAYSADEVEFMKACQAEKEWLGATKLTPRQILAIASRLGYRKVIAVAEVA